MLALRGRVNRENMKRILLLSTAFAAACGSSSSSRPWQQLANICVTPQSSSDKQGALADEEKFLKAWSDDTYLWYRELPSLDPTRYATAVDYFNALKSPALTASNNPRDKFHFTYPTAVWNQLAQSGVEVGYGMEVVLISRLPPREAVVAYTEPNSPAADPAKKIARGAHILQVDGQDLVNGTNVAALNAGLFPANANETHTFQFKDAGTGTLHTETLVSAAITHAPVPKVGALSSAPQVGYMLFNDHLATAEKALVDAVNTLKAANVTDLVLDIRYNGGGYLAIASELAYMLAGPGPTAGQTFERTVFNDKHPTADPITGQPLQPMPFLNQAVGLSVTQGQALPNLGLKQVFVLTGARTCSASEAVINGLRGVGINVIQIGSTTCGKPYGFYGQDNCGTTYFTIQFQGVNAKGFGDYSDGFVPARTDLPNGIAGCQVADDFQHALGDPAELRLAAALQYRASPGSCPAATFARSSALTTPATPEGEMVKPPWRENRLYWRN